MIGLSDCEEIMTLALFVLIQYQSVTDRQTDGQTDRHSYDGNTSACIAWYAIAMVKTYHFKTPCRGDQFKHPKQQKSFY